MKTNQLKIFLSSTFVDLEETREKILKFLGVLESDLISMELFGSSESLPKDVCIERVNASNFFIGIYAERYGSIEIGSGISLTQMEYERAFEMLEEGLMKGILLYALSPDASWPVKYVDKEADKIEKMTIFKELISKRHTISYFKDENELPFDILRDTIRKLEIGTNVPFKTKTVRKIRRQNHFERPLGMGFFSQELASLFFGRSTDIEALRDQIISYNFSLLIGVSGMGKTSLLNAGIIPSFDRIGWVTCITRPLNDPMENLRRSIWNSTVDGQLSSEFSLDDVVRTALEVHQGKKLLIIIDQFDDILNYENRVVTTRIVDDLNLLFGLRNPNLHILISYRGDVESEIGMIWQKISGAADGLPRYYLEPLNGQNAKDILDGTLKSMGIELRPKELSNVLLADILSESKNISHKGIFPPFLQMVISAIYENRTDERLFLQETYNAIGTGKGIISGYLFNQLDYLGMDKQDGIRFLIALVSNYGTKIQKTLEQIGELSGLDEDAVLKISGRLLDLRLVRSLENGLEITHDLLANTIMNGLMTDEEKEIRRFKFLLESKAQAYPTTQSALMFSEHLHVYKYRERIPCNEEEFSLMVISSGQNNLPVSYWLNIDNISLLSDKLRAKLLVFNNAIRENNLSRASYDAVPYNFIDYSEFRYSKKQLMKYSLANREEKMAAFFRYAIRNLEESDYNEFGLNHKKKYGQLIAIVAMGKFGTVNDLDFLVERIQQPEVSEKQKYLCLRSIIHLVARLKHSFSIEKFLLNFSGPYWLSSFDDFVLNRGHVISLDDLFNRIAESPLKSNQNGFLVEYIKKIATPENRDIILEFVRTRVLFENGESFFDKYFQLALHAGASFDYFLHLICNAQNSLDIQFSSLIHEQIAELALESDYSSLKIAMEQILLNDRENNFFKPGGPVFGFGNVYYYVWVISTAFCRLSKTADKPVIISLLNHRFFTVRHAALIRISQIGTSADFKHFFDLVISGATTEEFNSALFMLDVKEYLDEECIRLLEIEIPEWSLMEFKEDPKRKIPRGISKPVQADSLRSYDSDELPF